MKNKKDKTYGNQVNYKNKDVSEGQNLIVSIPKNFFENKIYKNSTISNAFFEQFALHFFE